MKRSEVLFLMGNGPSLGRLTDEEKRVVNSYDSMGMNVFLKHYQELGIIPTHFLQLDYDEVSAQVMGDLPELAEHPMLADTTFWLSPFWFDQCGSIRERCRLVGEVLPHLGRPLYLSRQFWDSRVLTKNYHWLIDRLESRGRRVFTYSRLAFFWGRSLEEPILRLNGTLTSALNIAWILGYREVQLVGVDLNDGRHFHPTDPRLVERDNRRHGVDSLRHHATTVWSNDGNVPPVPFVVRQIEKLFRKTGRRLYISNPQSVLATSGIVPHRSVLDAGRLPVREPSRATAMA